MFATLFSVLSFHCVGNISQQKEGMGEGGRRETSRREGGGREGGTRSPARLPQVLGCMAPALFHFAGSLRKVPGRTKLGHCQLSVQSGKADAHRLFPEFIEGQ